MPIPSGVETVTVTSGVPLTLPDGTLYRGHIRFIAPDLAVVPSDDYTLGGEAVAELVAGEFSITLVPQDATGINPTGWTFTVVGEFKNAPGWTQYVQLTKNSPNVVLSDILSPGSTEPTATGIYIPVAGGTMTGPLILSQDPTTDLGAATKQYVDDMASEGGVTQEELDPQLALKLNKSGGTMTGDLVLAADPDAALEAATKQYVDNLVALRLAKAGGTLTGAVISDLATAATIAFSSQVAADAAVRFRRLANGLHEWGDGTLAPDTNLYRMAANILGTDDTFQIGTAGTLLLGAAGDVNLYRLGADSMATDDALSVFGDLMVAADPTAALQVATKQYVDNASGGGFSIPFAEARIVDHDLSDMVSAPTWTIMVTSAGTQMKCSINASIGDRIKVCPNFMWNAGPHFMDWTILGLTGLPERYDTTRSTTPPTEGAPIMYPSASFPHADTGIYFTVTSDNLVSGQATIALAHQGTSSGFKVYAHATYPWVLRLENWGPEPS